MLINLKEKNVHNLVMNEAFTIATFRGHWESMPLDDLMNSMFGKKKVLIWGNTLL